MIPKLENYPLEVRGTCSIIVGLILNIADFDLIFQFTGGLLIGIGIAQLNKAFRQPSTKQQNYLE